MYLVKKTKSIEDYSIYITLLLLLLLYSMYKAEESQ
jgi:hypothetical protein